MSELTRLTAQVAEARRNFIGAASQLTIEQAYFKPNADVWSITEIVEHLVWAEWGGINSIWKALQGVRTDNPVFTGEAKHQGLPIEAIIEKTWKEKEQVPESAKPKWGGPIQYWISALEACQDMLETLARELEGMDLDEVIYPHVISGPLNARQRFEFLRFHLKRHQRQIEHIKQDPHYPEAKSSVSTNTNGKKQNTAIGKLTEH